MKCKHCDGVGFFENGASQFKCVYCDGTGEVEQTNEEWLKSANTEQLAEFLNLIIRVGPYENEPKNFWEHVYGRGGDCGAKSIVTWLKQPHSEVDHGRV